MTPSGPAGGEGAGPVFGTWPANDIRRAFVDGVAWWEHESKGATIWSSDRTKAEAEAERRYGALRVTPTGGEARVALERIRDIADGGNASKRYVGTLRDIYVIADVALRERAAPVASPGRVGGGRAAKPTLLEAARAYVQRDMRCDACSDCQRLEAVLKDAVASSSSEGRQCPTGPGLCYAEPHECANVGCVPVAAPGASEGREGRDG